MSFHDPKDLNAAGEALISWCESQGLSSGEGMIVFSRVIAMQIVGTAVAESKAENLKKEIEIGLDLIVTAIREDVAAVCLEVAGVGKA